MQEEIKDKKNVVLTIQEYLEKRKEKQGIDQNESECYDT